MEAIKAVIEQNTNGHYSVYIDNVDDFNFGCVGVGETEKKAIADFETALKELADYFRGKGDDFPDAVEIQYQFDYSSAIVYYSKIFSLNGLNKITGIPESALLQYINGNKQPTKTIFNKIKTSLHKFGRELAKA